MKIQHGDKGFWLEMDNGLTLSIQYGKANYCERQSYAGYAEEPKPEEISSRDFEWAVLDERGCISMGGDSVQGRVPFSLLGEVIARAQALPEGAKYVEPLSRFQIEAGSVSE